ncbi:MAG: hypothetical protein AAGL49_09435 [Pseudomonadota bacterium]
MADWTTFFGHWESWAYGGLVLTTVGSAYLSGRRSLTIGAAYLAAGWVASILIYLFSQGATSSAPLFLMLDAVLALLFFNLARNAAWAGYVFIVHVSMAALHFKAFVLPEHGLAYAWALNAAFLIACGIVISESVSTRLIRRTETAS